VTENSWTQPQLPSTSTPAVETPVGAPVAPTTTPLRSRRSRVALAATLTAVGVAGGALIGVGTSAATTAGSGSETASQTAPTATLGRGGLGGFGGWPYGTGGGSTGATTGGSASSAATTVTADQQIGLVNIDTVLSYESGQAAGTGMVLSSDGEILTNNHVVEGATSISVTVVSTGQTYTATVVGTDPTDDVAVLQLEDASGLQVADFSDQAADLGDTVTAVGNAGGTGTPSAATGTVTAVEQTITASDGTGSNAERLDGLIETDADVQAGDSGGPLYDTASGEIVGMDTAASSGPVVDGYAIPIDDALAIAEQITGGVDNATIHQGYPAFLGVSVAPTASGGAGVAGVLSGGPAQAAGLSAGDVITSIDGTAIGSADDLATAMSAHDPGETVSVTWTDAAGTSQTAPVTLATGPAD
jgi:S1-C subfamily serine protease